MADLENFAELPETFAGVARVFPLPDVVVFPGGMQPIRVFEPRYRELLDDAMAGDRLIAMATLQPGWEPDYEGKPDVWPYVCVGRVVSCSAQPGGDSNILLVGSKRARITRELSSDKAFREAIVDVIDDEYPHAMAAERGELRLKLVASFRKFLSKASTAQQHFDQLLASDISLGLLVDIIGFTLNISLEAKKQLIAEANVDRRVELVLSQTDAGSFPGSATPGPPFPPPFSAN